MIRVSVLIACIILSGAAPALAQKAVRGLEGEPVFSVKDVLSSMEDGSLTLPQGLEQIRRLSTDRAVRELIIEAENPQRRELTYYTLSQIGAAKTSAGLRQLLSGLQDENPGIRAQSVRALVQTPEDSRNIAVAALGGIIEDGCRDENTELCHDTLRTLGKIASPADRFLLKPARRVFSQARGHRHRAAAASTMLRIGGVPWSVAAFRDSDSAGLGAGLEALAVLGATSKGSFHTDASGRAGIRGVVWTGVAHENAETRRLAYLVVPLLFGPDPDSPSSDQLKINREIKTMLEARSNQETDLRMRSEVDEILVSLSGLERVRTQTSTDSDGRRRQNP